MELGNTPPKLFMSKQSIFKLLILVRELQEIQEKEKERLWEEVPTSYIYRSKFSVSGIWQRLRASHLKDGNEVDDAITVFTGVSQAFMLSFIKLYSARCKY